jgi:ribosomal protein S14
MSGLMQNLRYALRAVAQEPGVHKYLPSIR